MIAVEVILPERTATSLVLDRIMDSANNLHSILELTKVPKAWLDKAVPLLAILPAA